MWSKKNNMTKKIRLADITAKWMGAPYEEYGNDPEKGCDCLSFILNILKEYGYRIPVNFEGLTRYNYMDEWHENKDKTIKKLHRFLLSITTRKELNRMRSGDIILVKHKKLNEKSFMMYAGNSKVIIVNPKFGVLAMPIREVDVLNVYRGFH